MMQPPVIGDYGIIGDCRSAALVSNTGSVDWLCWPTFSGPPLFGQLLDPKAGGAWSVAPRSHYSCSRRYVGPTNVLETTFRTSSGTVKLTDFMPVAPEAHRNTHLTAEHQLTRVILCEDGSVDLSLRFAPRAGFGRGLPAIKDMGPLGLRVEVQAGALTLQSGLAWDREDGEARTRITLKTGERRSLILTLSSEGPAVLPPLESVEDDLRRTLTWWEEWSSQFRYEGLYSSAVQRSVLVLKLLQFSPTGAFVAAPTTSLPEKIGGELNWDYRYCWLRDASFNVRALCGTGYREEAAAFLEWMLHATRLTQPKLMTVYNLFGNAIPNEKEIQDVAGYRGSLPVRTGNMAGEQHQLDTYGEVICGAAQLIGSSGFMDSETQRVLVRFGEFVAEHWKDPDSGIWESRSKPAVHTHSRLLCWVALDELLKMHEKGGIRKMPVSLFRRVQEEIRSDLETNCWNEREGAYTSMPGSSDIDAVLLLFAMHNFDAPDSSRLQATFHKVRETLYAGDGLIYRNREGGGEPKEGAFGICSFWVTEFLAMGGGTLSEARESFETVLRYANDLGLFSEEIDPTSGALIGNFPQTFTHVGLVNAALAITKRAAEEPA